MPQTLRLTSGFFRLYVPSKSPQQPLSHNNDLLNKQKFIQHVPNNFFKQKNTLINDLKNSSLSAQQKPLPLINNSSSSYTHNKRAPQKKL